jgi:hypothetical protein
MDSHFDPSKEDPTPHMRGLLERLTRIGWIRASRMDTNSLNSLWVDWTDKGKQSAIMLADLFDKLDPTFTEEELFCLRFLIDYYYRRPGSHFAKKQASDES